MISKFWIGLNPRFQSYKFIPANLNIMASAGGYWDHTSGDFKRKRFPGNWKYIFLDSGGFTLLNKYGDYPFSHTQYLSLVSFLRPALYASLDYPCEPEITRTINHMSNTERIEHTVNNARLISEWEGHVKSRIMFVIQGYSFDEYIYCLDLYKRAGLIRPIMAVGSMCRRNQDNIIRGLIERFEDVKNDYGIVGFHYFGLKFSKNLADINNRIYSRDSAVALDSYSAQERANRNGRRWPQGQKEKEVAFFSFLERIKSAGMNAYGGI